MSQPWSVPDGFLKSLTGTVHPPSARLRYLLMLRLYLDDSRSGGDLTVVAGWIAPESVWDGFQVTWASSLLAAGVREFHATDFYAARGEFDGWELNSAKHDRFAKRFIDAAATAKVGVGRGIDRAAYDEAILPQEFMAEGTPNNRFTPLMFCLRTCLEWVSLFWVGRRGFLLEPIAVILEEGKGCGEAIEYCNHLKRRGVPWMQCFLTFTTAPKSFAPLQAADLIAHETKRHLTDFVGLTHQGRRKSFARMVERSLDINIAVGNKDLLLRDMGGLREALSRGDQGAIARFWGTKPPKRRKPR